MFGYNKITPSWPIKARSMMSTMKKTSVKCTYQPIDILQDLPVIVACIIVDQGTSQSTPAIEPITAAMLAPSVPKQDVVIYSWIPH